MLESERQGRSAFTEAKRVWCAPSARRTNLDGEVGDTRQRRVLLTPNERLDDRGDVVAMRDEPSRQRIDDPGDERRTHNGRRDAQKDRAAERIREGIDRHAGEPVIKALHCRHPGNRAENGRKKEAEPLAPGAPRLRQAMAVACRQLAADT